MGKRLIICEKPSVAREYAKTLGVNTKKDGYFTNDEWIITWCVGHLVTMSYPEKYDPALKKWNLKDLPFLPEDYRYEVKREVKKQFDIVKSLYKGKAEGALSEIILAGDSAREGIYIQELVRREVHHDPKIPVSVVWIDSFTESEIRRGIKDRKPLSAYKELINAAYMRAIEDYATGINFSRALTCKFGYTREGKYHPVSVGRVMTTVLGMVIRRENEIENFKETQYHKITADCGGISATWKATEGSRYAGYPGLYENVGFLDITDANDFMDALNRDPQLTVSEVKTITEKKYAPPLYNLAELQADCSKKLKIDPNRTLEIAQTLYERKLTTYPRTDARVLSTAVMNEINEVIAGVIEITENISPKGGKPVGRSISVITGAVDSDSCHVSPKGEKPVGRYITATKSACSITSGNIERVKENKRYVDDTKISDHYAIIPTGEGDLSGLSDIELQVYFMIVSRFLSIFYPSAEYEKTDIVYGHSCGEKFFASFKRLKEAGYLTVAGKDPEAEDDTEASADVVIPKKGKRVSAVFKITDGKTNPPKRYTSGSLILAMENAGKFIDDEELRLQIKGSGIGTSATRAAIIDKLLKYRYLYLSKKSQVITPAPDGRIVYEIVDKTIPELLIPDMTAKWEKSLSLIEDGLMSAEDYRKELEDYVRQMTERVKTMSGSTNQASNATEERRIIGKCPRCGGDIRTTSFGYGCSNYRREEDPCKFTVGTIAGVKIDESDVIDLITKGETRKISGFTSKKGNKFDAKLKLNEDKEVKFEF